MMEEQVKRSFGNAAGGWRAVLVILIVAVNAAAAGDSTVTVPRVILERIEAILDKSGVFFAGKVASGHFGSILSGEGINPTGRKTEADRYSTVDLDINARPRESVGARVRLRLHHNWQNFWSDPGNPVFSRWVSIDGTIKGVAPFHAGDFFAQLSPLLLHMPQVEVMYEPQPFSRLRKAAMEDAQLHGTERPLEGVAFGLHTKIPEPVDSVTLDFYGTRLRSVETGTAGGSFVVTNSEADPRFSKYFAGSDLGVRVVKGLSVHGSYLIIADYLKSGDRSDPLLAVSAQKTHIAGFRGEADIASITGLDDSELRFYGEAALSFDDTAWNASAGVRHATLYGSAVYGGVSLRKTVFGMLLCHADLQYLRNKKTFRNELAQSPAFIGRRIMNIEGDAIKDLPGVDKAVANHYSTFDALYHHVFKFCPSTETNLWHKAPYTKNSYGSNVYTKQELQGIVDSLLDPAVQLVMPFGQATPDRQGVRMRYRCTQQKAGVELQVLLGFLTGERRAAALFPRDAREHFRELGAGGQIDLSKAVRFFRYPALLSASVVRSSAEHDTGTILSDFINAGLQWQFTRRMTASTGIQKVLLRYDDDLQLRQTYMLAGLDYRLSRSVDLYGSVGKLIVVNKTDNGFHRSPHRASGGSFDQMLSELSLNVVF